MNLNKPYGKQEPGACRQLNICEYILKPWQDKSEHDDQNKKSQNAQDFCIGCGVFDL
jgi:hypothetical protein